MNIVILGTGYAGMAALHTLGKMSEHTLVVVERNSYHTYTTLLHHAATYGEKTTLPLRTLLEEFGAEFWQAAVVNVNVDTRTVETKKGKLTYDILLIALGSVTNFFRIPGLAEAAVQLKSLEDANTIHQWLEAVYTPASTANRDILIGGGGLSGVELASELALHTRELAKAAGVPRGSIHLVEGKDILLPMLDKAQRSQATSALQDLGVQLHLGRHVTKAEAKRMYLDNGEVLEGSLLVWTGGVQAPDLVKGRQLELGASHRLEVTETLQLVHYPDVFVAGDMALALDAEHEAVALTGQLAEEQGRVAGKNIRALLEHKDLTAFKPEELGEFISLGGHNAVGWLQFPWGSRLHLHGVLAGSLKQASEWRHALRSR